VKLCKTTQQGNDRCITTHRLTKAPSNGYSNTKCNDFNGASITKIRQQLIKHCYNQSTLNYISCTLTLIWSECGRKSRHIFNNK